MILSFRQTLTIKVYFSFYLLLLTAKQRNVAVAFTTKTTPTSVCRSSPLAAESGGKKDNKSMSFLRNLGKVGTGQDFTNAMGVDEGPAGRSTGSNKNPSVRKAKSAYQSCVVSGIVDDMTESFPITSSGTLWSGFTDQVMGGSSFGSLTRETYEGRTANVLRGKVELVNNGGFIQMATDLALDPAVSTTVDASKWDGIEIDVQYSDHNDDCEIDYEQETTDCSKDKESFNIHLKNNDCTRQFSSYRAEFEASFGTWKTIRLPWDAFLGKGPGAEDVPFDVTTLRRLGVVAIGKEMHFVVLAVSGLRFYTE